MGIGKQHPLGSQFIHVGGPGLGIALQHAGPVIQIIDGDEQYIRLSVLEGGSFPFAVCAHYAKQEN